MDMAFVAATNASSSFPPHDPWMAGEDLNYYYLGHLAMAMPAKLLGVGPDEGYNLAFAMLGALSAAAVFTLGGTLWAAARPPVRGGAVAVGVLAVVVCIVLGNLAGVQAWLDASGPPGDYDWFAPSRVIPDTINEFPWFSMLLQDLHAHVLAIPFTLVALALRAPGAARRATRRRGVAGRRRGARRRARDRGRSTPSTRGRIRSPPACSCSRWRRGRAAMPPAGGARTPPSGSASCWPPAWSCCCRSGWPSTRAPAASGWSTSARRSPSSWPTRR